MRSERLCWKVELLRSLSMTHFAKVSKAQAWCHFAGTEERLSTLERRERVDEAERDWRERMMQVE